MTLFSWFIKNKNVNDLRMEMESDKNNVDDEIVNTSVSINKAAMEQHQQACSAKINGNSINQNMWPTASVRPPDVLTKVPLALKKQKSTTKKTNQNLPKIKAVSFIKESL